jgi:peroxiredoxin
MADNQINDRTRAFIDEARLRDRVHFLSDSDSRSIDALGIRKLDAEPMEAGVPHPATYLLDREGRVRFVDVRQDFHIWLDPSVLRSALSEMP